jgi:hypothetical protein
VLAQLVVGCSDIYGKISSSHELSPITANTILAINTTKSQGTSVRSSVEVIRHVPRKACFAPFGRPFGDLLLLNLSILLMRDIHARHVDRTLAAGLKNEPQPSFGPFSMTNTTALFHQRPGLVRCIW